MSVTGACLWGGTFILFTQRISSPCVGLFCRVKEQLHIHLVANNAEKKPEGLLTGERITRRQDLGCVYVCG